MNKSISRSVFKATRMGNGFNQIMRAGGGYNKIIIYDEQKREIHVLFEATRTCVWMKLDVCSMCVGFATQPRTK